MKRRLVLAFYGTIATTMMIGFIDPKPSAPPTHHTRPAYAPSVMPTAPWVANSAAGFTQWVERHGTEEQRAAVLGHITRLLQSVPQEGHFNTYVATDHLTAEDARTRAIVDAYLAWAGRYDPTRMLVLYDIRGKVMGAVNVPDQR
ncbi:hypothetical protein ABTX81_17255 [Kitasatospora sp. NPDC097605]|uniref:hypothetical protein n=1 Tax=Kitasatospora sp. NPDC097605 TaxID=3157226 RepID=UPI00332BDBEA